MRAWEKWIPPDQTVPLEATVKDQGARDNKLEARRAEFLIAQRMAEEERRRGGETQPMAVPQPVVRIKPTRLPKFTGFKRNTFI